ncbi:hypothetical protein PRIPAC_79454 [Pristionchus pacificus]|nr:hypothetical protein PRIPAC_79454 [Pristionchus pacificus]
MIFLPPVHISPKKAIPIYHTKFVLGNYLYFIYDKDAETNWVMKRLDLKTFNHTSLDVQFEEGFQARIPEQSEGVIVKRGKAYSWNCRVNFLLEGRIDADCFHWRKINASGPMPPFRASFSIDDGTDNYLSFIAEGTGDETLSMYRLDLTTFVWSRQGMVIEQQIIVNELRSFPPWMYPWSDFLVGHQVHFIRFRGRSHLILDIATLEWTADESISPNYIYFSDGLQVHMIGKDDSTPQKRKSNKSIISRYDAGEMEWNQISQIANVHPIDQSRYDCFNVGTRIVIVEGFRHGRTNPI